MATLNLQKKKMMSESNYKRLVNILVGLMASQSTIESQCLFPYDETKTYSKNMICLYQNHLYLCKAATTGVFNPNSWEMQDDIINELSLDEVKNFLGLTPEQLETMADLISTEIRIDKVFSSSDTYTRIDNALKEAKQYCLTQLAKKSTGSFKIATSEAEVVDGNYLYLIMNSSTSKYEIFALVEGSVQKLTTVDVNLDNYFTKTEIEADFLKKTDADGKYATITTVDEKIDKTSILTANSSTATDEQVYSAKAINTELDGVVKKTDITTTINSTSTDTKVPSAKAVNTLLNNKVDKMVMLKSQNVDDLVNEGSYYVVEAINAPDAYGWIDVLANNDYTIQLFYPSITTNCEMYIRRRQNGVWSSGWQRVCTTKVADVPKTFVPFTVPSSITVYNPDRPDLFGLYYIVKNGVCYVDVTMSLASISQMNNFTTLCSVMPRPAMSYVRNETNSWNDKTAPTLCMAINGGESTFLMTVRNMSTSPMTPSNSEGHFGYFCSFSYPVAEE